MNLVESNLQAVHQKIEAAAVRSARDLNSIKLVAISKSQPAGAIREAHALGLRDFGENRVYEGLEKQSELHDLVDLHWHMVGHIQSRKAAEVPGNFHIVHSVDRFKIARRLNIRAAELEAVLPALLECNVSGEESKYGWELSQRESWGSALDDIRRVVALDHLDIVGLMTMAPWVDDNAVIRNTFQQLRALRDFLEDNLQVPLPELSMGMTDDYEIAIEEGATLLRIGRAIFGPRQG